MTGWENLARAIQNPLQWLALNAKRDRILNDPYYRFQSIAEIEFAAKLGIRIDVNQATIDDWLRLPIISIHQARSLVRLTQSGVQFYDLEDIADALELPVQSLRAIAPILQFCYYSTSE
ncbi:hypothetical protein PMH09_10385 [Roseofilum sp. BLCC_M143]|uniref:Uncharacterized protein n=1 Tax=Roseofilum casamattae BLCC-M143 TaxID=3022442 RepID=A0ABT7BXQ8_9CYAN|nr:hypothetical protein [Roseofilum casamattae]MDJ1183607.1 hypothetical protein [Roseofilum casamattae BLCC-M143]